MAEIPNNTAQQATAQPKWRERLRSRYADSNPQSDQEWDDLAERGFAEDEQKIKAHEENDKVIQDLLDSDKDLNTVVSEMIINGLPFRAAIAKYFDPEDLMAKEGDADYDYYQKSSEERKKMGQEFRARADAKNKNVRSTYDNIDKFAKKMSMDKAAKDEFIGFVDKLYEDISMLNLSMQTLEKLYKAMTFDEAVADAAESASIDAKNGAIEAARVRKASATAGDGVPTPQGGSAPSRENKPKNKGFFDDIPKRKF